MFVWCSPCSKLINLRTQENQILKYIFIYTQQNSIVVFVCAEQEKKRNKEKGKKNNKDE
jgi:hypothetical protein